MGIFCGWVWDDGGGGGGLERRNRDQIRKLLTRFRDEGQKEAPFEQVFSKDSHFTKRLRS